MYKETFARVRGVYADHSAQTAGKCVVWGTEQTWVSFLFLALSLDKFLGRSFLPAKEVSWNLPHRAV